MVPAEQMTFPIELAVNKCSHGFMETYIRATLCNWLVCIAVAQSTAANSLGGKFIGEGLGRWGGGTVLPCSLEYPGSGNRPALHVLGDTLCHLGPRGQAALPQQGRCGRRG